MSNLAIIEKGDKLAQVLIQGDLSKLSTEEKTAYFLRVCETVGLNPFTKPFQYIKLNGREVLYATRDCADQLRKNNNVSIYKIEKENLDGLYIVTAYAKLPNGREDSATGALTVKGLSGEGLANALMKAETKAKRRVTLSICGLGILDETELDSIHINTQGQEKAREVTQKLAETHTEETHAEVTALEETEEPSIGDYVRTAGKDKGKKLDDIPVRSHENLVKWCKETKEKGEILHVKVLADLEATEFYLARLKESENA